MIRIMPYVIRGRFFACRARVIERTGSMAATWAKLTKPRKGERKR